MIDHLREVLYPLGFVAQIAFGGRLFLQWISSEIKGKSYVSPGFWRLTILANLVLLLHSLIQVQYHVCIATTCITIISWRNLNLMQPHHRQARFSTVLLLLITIIMTVTFAFVAQSYFSEGEDIVWLRIPSSIWHNPRQQIHTFWHVIGIIGVSLFALRFWVQWWFAELKKVSYLGYSFWWCSVIGDILSLLYFARIADVVNILGPVFGLIPHLRNLILLYKEQQQTTIG